MGYDGLILHVDADAFFASVEQRQKPSTARAPVIVCGLGPRGVVATASYQARRFGVGSAMATATAMRRCPHGVFLAPRMQAYSEHSGAIMTVLSRFADVLEQVSIDEAYLQLHSPNLSADQLITEAAAAVWHATGLRVSVGAGHSKLLAKLASTSAKPQGLRVITSEQQQPFLDALPVSALPGIGPVTAARLTEMGIDTVAQLRAQPTRLLQRLLGTAAGTAAIAMAQGCDTRPVGPSREAKKVSTERTMDYDVPASQLEPVLDTVLTAAHTRLTESGAAARTVTVRLRDTHFTTIGRSVSLPQASTDLGELRPAALTALRAATEAMGLDTEEESGAGARLLGVALGALSTSTQLTLLPSDTAHQLPTDPTTLSLPQQDNQPTGLGHRADDWLPGRDVQHAELGRGWVVRSMSAQDSPSGKDELHVRFETTNSRSARQYRFPIGDPHLTATTSAAVQPIA
jgi:DNA polymerase-4